MTTRGMVVSGELVAVAVRRMTFEEARHSIPELTQAQYEAIKDGRATFTGNSEDGVEFKETGE